MLEAGLVAGLPGQPLQEPFQVRECGVPSRPTQRLAALLAPLCGQPVLEGDSLLEVEGFESAVFGGGFKSGQRIGSGVHRGLAVALRLLEEREVLALDPVLSEHRAAANLESPPVRL